MSTNIQNCQFIGVQWDEDAIEAVNLVAEGLLNLTKLFISQNIKIESLLYVGSQKAAPTESDDSTDNEECVSKTHWNGIIWYPLGVK